MKLGYALGWLGDYLAVGEKVGELAQTLEDCGVESIWTTEHLFMAKEPKSVAPTPDGKPPFPTDASIIPDPLELLSYVAASTKTLRLGTGVMIPALHNPVLLAKRAATLDALSGGRLMLGVGVGWQREEYEASGVPWAERGRRLDECIEVMRALWTQRPASYTGEFTRFEEVYCLPPPVQADGVPIIVGGCSKAALRRAAAYGDGWYPINLTPAETAKALRRVRAMAEDIGRDPDTIEVTVFPFTAPVANGRGANDLDLLKRFADVGIDRVILVSMETGTRPDDFGAIRKFLEDYQTNVFREL